MSWGTFQENSKGSERTSQRKGQRVGCHEHENSKAKYGLEAESLVNLSMLSDCSCSVCNFVKNVSFKQLNVSEPAFKNVGLRLLF